MSVGRDFIDASLFMGMHSQDEASRIACKDFFVGRLHSSVMMSLEHVGRCDDMVWQYGRAVQDAYYPFMDNLHTDMRIVRRGYQEQDLRLALSSPLLQGLPMFERLLLAMVMNHEGTLYSINRRLLGRPELPVQAPSANTEARFPSKLEQLYEVSLQFRVPATDT